MTELEVLELATELAESWENGNRSHVCAVLAESDAPAALTAELCRVFFGRGDAHMSVAKLSMALRDRL